MSEHRVDVCVVGAGAAGIACAQGLVAQGASVALLDRLHPMPDCLKAEKIGGEGVLALLRLGFQPAVEAALTPLRNVSVFFGRRSLGTLPIDPPEAGLLYHDFINNLRKHLDARVDFRPGTKAVAFEQEPDQVVVLTGTDERISCRLVVLATGDAKQLLESLGAVYEPQMPFDTFVAAFTLEGEMVHRRIPVDTLTFHHPVAGGPIAYATFFRLGTALRANIFCPGPTNDDWQRDLKQRPLETLVSRNRTLAEVAHSWRVVSPVMIRKLRVTRMRPPTVGRIVALGDAAHTIDPSGGGGLNFALMEAELFLSFYAPSWLQRDVCDYEAIQAFYDDPRRAAAVDWYFNRGRYIFALNHDRSLPGHLRRLRFALDHLLTSRLGSRRNHRDLLNTQAWQLPAPYLYEQYAEGSKAR